MRATWQQSLAIQEQKIQNAIPGTKERTERISAFFLILTVIACPWLSLLSLVNLANPGSPYCPCGRSLGFLTSSTQQNFTEPRYHSFRSAFTFNKWYTHPKQQAVKSVWMKAKLWEQSCCAVLLLSFMICAVFSHHMSNCIADHYMLSITLYSQKNPWMRLDNHMPSALTD